MAATISKKAGSKVAMAFALVTIVHSLIVLITPWLFPEASSQALFLLFWSTAFTFTGLLSGLSFEVTRAVAAASTMDDGAADDAVTAPTGADATDLTNPAVALNNAAVPLKRPRIVWTAWLAGIGVAILLTLAAWWWGPQVFTAEAVPLALLVAVLVVGFACDQGIAGVLAGQKNWNLYAGLMAANVAIRLVLVVGVALFTRSVVAAAAALAATFFTWVIFFIATKPVKAAFRVRSDSPVRTTLSRIGASSAATGLAALLGVGFPTLLAITSTAAEMEQAAPLILSITLTRAPLMLPLTGIQGIVVSHFASNPAGGLRRVRRYLLITFGVGSLVSIAAGLLGPWLLTLIWGADFRVSGPILAGLSAGATGLALLTLTGAICQAIKLHRTFLMGWIVAVVVALLALLLPVPLATKSVLALLIGPFVGVALHLIALIRNPNTPTESDAQYV